MNMVKRRKETRRLSCAHCGVTDGYVFENMTFTVRLYTTPYSKVTLPLCNGGDFCHTTCDGSSICFSSAYAGCIVDEFYPTMNPLLACGVPA